MNTTFEDKLSESLTRHAAALRPPSGVDHNSLGRAVQKRGDNRQRRARSLTAAGVVVSLAVGGFGIGAYINREKSNLVVADGVNELRLLPSWTPPGSTLSISEGPYGYGSRNSLTVWGTAPENTVSVSVYSMPGIDGRSLGQALLAEAKGKPAADGFVGLDWTVPGAQINLFITNANQTELRAVASSLSIDTDTLKVTAFVPPLGMPLRFAGTQEMVQPVRSWSVRLQGSDMQVTAEIPNKLRTDLFGDPYANPAQFETVKVRGHQAKAFVAGGPTKSDSQHAVQWTEGEWLLRVTGSQADAVLRVAQSLKPAGDDAWDALVVRRHQPTPREADPVSQTVSGEGVGIELQLLAKDGSCVEAVLKVPEAKEEYICVPINQKNLMWSGLRSGGGKRFAISFVSDQVDALTVVSPGQAKPTGTVGSAESNATWAEGAVIKIGPSTWTWVGVAIQEIFGESPVSLDLFMAEPSVGSVEVQADDVADSQPAEDESGVVDYPLRFIERVTVD